MKVTYDEKTKNDFTPFRLILEFEKSDDLKAFYAILHRTDSNSLSEFEMFEQIHDAINLKTTL
jgi:hypothetical protein